MRTNSEALIGGVSGRKEPDLSRGIAIGFILHTDEHSHLEPVRYSDGLGFFRLMMAPHVSGARVATRLARLAGLVVRHPWRLLKAMCVPNFARRTLILLYMRTLDGHLKMKRGLLGLGTALQEGPALPAGQGAAVQARADVAVAG